MDIATLIGLSAAIGILLHAISLGSSLAIFFDLPSALIVLGGTLSVTLIHQRFGNVVGAFGLVLHAFADRTRGGAELIPAIVELAQRARKEGMLALDGIAIRDPFLARGVRLGLDGLAPEAVASILANEIAFTRERHELGQKIFRFMASSAPAMGMIGTVIGLVQMLHSLDDPEKIGPGMAVALLTTFYGALLAFVVCTPIAEKLEARTNEEVARKKLVSAGVTSILRGESGSLVKSKLEAFLPAGARESARGMR
jgi:chemotaxis protein MotA